jgi:hypothetical protein
MRERHGGKVIGFDYNSEVVKQHQEAGRNVIKGDPLDLDFWDRAQKEDHKVTLVMLAMSSLTENMEVARLLKSAPYFKGMVAATARFDDEVEALKESGVDAAFNVYGEAGAGFAGHICNSLDGACEIVRVLGK